MKTPEIKDETKLILDDSLGLLYKGDTKANDYCKTVIRIEDPRVRAAYANLIVAGCTGKAVEKFVITIAKHNVNILERIVTHSPISNATHFKNKLSNGFKITARSKPKDFFYGFEKIEKES